MGRKNWLFADGVRTVATLFTMTSSCHRHGIDGYLLQRLAHEPPPPPERQRAWLPDRAAAETDPSVTRCTVRPPKSHPQPTAIPPPCVPARRLAYLCSPDGYEKV